MKRAKIMLMVIAVLAVVGGALAFKASNFAHSLTLYGCTTTNVQGVTVTGCLKPFIIALGTLTTDPNNGVAVAGATTKITTDCINDPSQCSTLTTFSPAE